MFKKKTLIFILIFSFLFINAEFPVKAENILKITHFYIDDNNNAILTFNDAVMPEKLKDSITLTDYDGFSHNDFSVTESNEENSLKINFDTDYKYFLKVDNDLVSKTDTQIDRKYIFNLTFDGIKDSFVNNGYETDNWCTHTVNSKKYTNAKILDNMLFLSPDYTGNDYNYIEYNGQKTIYNNGGCIVRASDYEKYMFGDSTLEFDYANYSHIKSCEAYDCMRVFFRTDKYKEETVNYSYDWHQRSEQGAYILEIYGSGTKLSLRKWNGEAIQFENLTANNTASGKITDLKTKISVSYNCREIYHYKITAANVQNGVKIDIKRAKNIDGVLGEYENVVSYTDTDNPLMTGTFWFSSRGSYNDISRLNNWCWYSSHLLGNIIFRSTNARYTIADISQIYVSPDAEDNGIGTFQNPFGNIETAKNKASEYVSALLKLGEKQQINIIFRGGSYYFDKTINLTQTDSGFDNDNRIVYKAYENEVPEFKGSIPLNNAGFNNIEDETVKSRLRAEVKENILCFNLKENGIESIPNNPINIQNYVSLYCNGREEMISQWPDGDYNYSLFSLVDGGTGFEYLYTNRPSHWTAAQDIVILGNMGVNYTGTSRGVESIDTDKNIIYLKNGNVTNTYCKRWKAVNLLEEISIPGEWYINRENMLLYYYPSEAFESSELELAVASYPMFTVNDCKNITFSGIHFGKTCSDVFYNLADREKSIENFTVENCEFSGVGGNAVHFESHIFNALYDNEYYSNRIGRVKNIAIRDNIFYNNRQTPIVVYSGDTVACIDDGLTVSGNYSTSVSAMGIDANAGLIGGSAVNADISNNLVHNVPWSAVTMSGQSNKITNNEFVNTVRETIDAGTIYMGRTVMKRNTEIAYNLFYNTNPVSKELKKYTHNRAVYFDDGYCGGIVHHNIGVNGDKFVSQSGSGGKIYSNTIVDYKNGIVLDPRGLSGFYTKLFEDEHTGAAQTEFDKFDGMFPQIREEYNTLKDYNYKITVNNEVRNNYLINSNELKLSGDMAKNNAVKENEYTSSYTLLKNANGNDYRLQKSDITNKHNLIDDTFDLNGIGIQWGKEIEKSDITSKRDFKLLGMSKDDDDYVFAWEKAFDADYYKIVIAADKEMSDIVYEENVTYNFAKIYDVDSLGKTLYWTVYAINETKNLSGEWKATGEAKAIKVSDSEHGSDCFEIKYADKEEFDIRIAFSDAIDETSISDFIEIYDENGISYPVEIVCDKNTAMISIEKIPFSKNRYYLKIKSGAQSINNNRLKTDKYFSFAKDGTLDTFDDENGYESNDYMMYSYMGDRERKAFIYNNSLFVSSSRAENCIYENVPYAEFSSLIYRKDFADNQLDDSELAFDYCDYSVLNGNGSYSVFRMFFGVSDFEVTNVKQEYNGIFASSNSGSYFLEISNYGNDIALRKWDGKNSNVSDLKGTLGSVLAYEREIENYNAGDKLRFKIVTESKDFGTLINVYCARYNGNTAGKYKRIISVFDEERNNCPGSFFMTGYGSAGCQFYYMNSRSIDNIIFEKNEKMTEVMPYVIENSQINRCVDGYEITSTVNSIEKEASDSVIFNAVYLNGKLESAVGQRQRINMGMNECKIKIIFNADEAENYEHKTFLWNPQTLKPMCKAFEYK